MVTMFRLFTHFISDIYMYHVVSYAFVVDSQYQLSSFSHCSTSLFCLSFSQFVLNI